jgi:hypothetical protein
MVSLGGQLSIGAADLLVGQLGEPAVVSPMAWCWLSENYGVTDIFGFRNGYQGLPRDAEPVRLTRALVADIHNRGGTILGTSRGPQDTAEVVTTRPGRRIHPGRAH